MAKYADTNSDNANESDANSKLTSRAECNS